MRVAINTGPLTGGHAVRGIGVHTKAIIEEFPKIAPDNIRIEAEDFTQADLAKYDVVHYPYFSLFFASLPLTKPAKRMVVTIHDVIPLIYPEHYPPGVKGTIRFIMQRWALKNTDAVITISETSKKDICRLLAIQPDKVSVIPLAPRHLFRKMENGEWKMEIRNKYGLPDSFALYVGDVNYNKNIPTLLKACKIAGLPLVICGKQAKDIEDQGFTHAELTHFKNVDFSRVIKLGFVPDEDLVKICNLASVYVQPSLYEGFGLPVLEAFAAGTPVVAAKTQALVEIAGDGAVYADPASARDMGGKIKEVVSDTSLRAKLVEKGAEVVKKYSWEKTAKQTLDVYKAIHEQK